MPLNLCVLFDIVQLCHICQLFLQPQPVHKNHFAFSNLFFVQLYLLSSDTVGLHAFMLLVCITYEYEIQHECAIFIHKV